MTLAEGGDAVVAVVAVVVTEVTAVAVAVDVDADPDVADVEAAAAADLAALETFLLKSCWLTTAEYCCISMTAASKRTWMFLKHRILASTLTRSFPSMARSSVSVRPAKFCGGIGGGTLKGGMNIGGGKNGGAAKFAALF